MKKGFTVLIILILLCVTYFFLNTNRELGIKEKLSNIGYKNDEIEIINKLNDENINHLLTLPYNESYIIMMKNENFKEENLKAYISYKEEYNAPINDVITIINNDLGDNEYNNKLVSLVKEPFYIKDNLDRYYKYSEKYPTLDINTIVKYVNANLDYDYYSTNYKSDFTKGKLVLVNKYYSAGNFEPTNLVHITSAYGGNYQYIQDIVFEDYKKMYNDMKKEGLNLIVKSSYRSYTYQSNLYNNYVIRDGKDVADTYSARAGNSEHQTGLAIDVGTPTTNDLGDFLYTNEYTWMINNAHKYGFILRFKENETLVTGYMYEPWHFRYVGVKAATYIKENDLTFEEYYAYFVK